METDAVVGIKLKSFVRGSKKRESVRKLTT